MSNHDFSFNNKAVYILSPERWGIMRVSKHHYALELAEKGNDVYFIEPPFLSNKGVQVTALEEQPRLHIVKYKPVFRGQRFLPSFIYNLLLRWQIRILKKAIGKSPDVVWCFEPYRFLNLQWFGAPVTLFFAADRFSKDFLPPEIFATSFNLGISDSIVRELHPSGRPVYFINHGLSKHFAELAARNIGQTASAKPAVPVKAGYIGNLLMEPPDRATMRKVIEENRDVQFVFWGQYEKSGNLGEHDNPAVREFVAFLKSQPHVQLRGAVHPSALSLEMGKMDLFWICWQVNKSKLWDGSNAHKMLEYFSMGKPVVSHYMSTYRGSELIDMLPTTDNSGYTSLFAEVLQRVKNGEPEAVQKARIRFALDNTYSRHIHYIEELIRRPR
jgi:hypothetical protein